MRSEKITVMAHDEAKELTNIAEIVAGRATVVMLRQERESVVCRGSGTLVKYGANQGILTCAHVAEAVLKQDEIGLNLFSKGNKFQALKIKRADVYPVVLGNPPWSRAGPDIAFLQLPPDLMSSIGASANIVNLELQYKNALAGEPSGEAFDLVCGAVDEWIDDPEVSETRSTTTIEALLNIGKVAEIVERDGFDLLFFKPSPEDGFSLPRSYKGTSGGGLWRFYATAQTGGNQLISESRLMGVAFYETPEHVICHGPKSIFEKLGALARWRV